MVEVKHFREILLWPLQLMPSKAADQIQNHWQRLGLDSQHSGLWEEVVDEFTDDPGKFQERHYSEFVTFLPYVQRMLYGEGKGRASADCESPVRVFRRSDISQVRMTLTDPKVAPVILDVKHIDLYFFYDLDVVILAVEVHANNLNLSQVQDILYRFGRSYPTFWTPEGRGGNCMQLVEWLGHDGSVLAESDFSNREKYLTYVCRFRTPGIASHWEFLLRPLVPHHSDEKGSLRYRLLEYHRMPVMAYLAVDDPRAISRNDFVRLNFVTAPAANEQSAAPYSDEHLMGFESRYCIDRFWYPERNGSAGVRVLSSGAALLMIGGESDPYFYSPKMGLLEQFRHQYFLLFLVAHLQKAALLMMSDRLVNTLNQLNINDSDSVKDFKRRIRQIKEIFLRFTHRYWFQDVTDQAQAKDVYRMSQHHLGVERLYAEVKDEVEGMNNYLDSDSIRRQANTVLRLTVVTIFGLIGTVTTGFLGMNLIAEAENSLRIKLLYFAMVFVPTIWLTLYTMMKSKRLSDFLDALSDERVPLRGKWRALIQVWKK